MAHVRVRPLHFLLIGLCGILCMADSATAQCQYEVTAIIEPPPCPPPFTQRSLIATAINNHSHVVGYYEDCVTLIDEGVLWTPDEGLTVLPRPAGVLWMQPEDINDHGVICGTWGNTNVPGSRRGFVYWPDTQTYTELDTQSGGGWGMAHAINNSNVVVGERAVTTKAAPRIAYVWSQQDGFTDIGELEKNEISSAEAINEFGVVVGWEGNDAFIVRNGVLNTVGHASGSNSTQFLGISSPRSDLIVGVADGIYPRPIAWNGTFNDLPLLATHNIGQAHVVRDGPRQIGGYSRKFSISPPINEIRGVIWASDQVFDINDWAIGNPSTIQGIIDINSAGTVLGFAVGKGIVLTPTNASSGDIDGDCRTNRADLQLLLMEWGETKSAADLDNSGRVDVFDLLYLLSQWSG